ncbi:MAG: ABC-F family ATP-binding cassette domain-containing protein [Oscillibacter sp.]|nr:ABC-F family ATP-binding cassette domain-containing protein [Oscillibacter sp.]
MIEIQAKDIVKSFEVGNPVLNGLTFQVDAGERVGILGRNGTGKSTLFKILTGEIDYDTGQLTLAPGKRVGLISQSPFIRRVSRSRTFCAPRSGGWKSCRRKCGRWKRAWNPATPTPCFCAATTPFPNASPASAAMTPMSPSTRL